MKLVKSLSILGVGALALSMAFATARADDSQNTAQTQQPQRTTARTNTRRSYRSYSYEPSRGGDISRRAASPSYTRADTKVKFRYGNYPY